MNFYKSKNATSSIYKHTRCAMSFVYLYIEEVESCDIWLIDLLIDKNLGACDKTHQGIVKVHASAYGTSNS